MAQNDWLNIALSLQAMVGNFGAVLLVYLYYLLSTLKSHLRTSGIIILIGMVAFRKP